MTEIQNSNKYDLEERTLSYAKRVIKFVNESPKTLTNIEIGSLGFLICLGFRY